MGLEGHSNWSKDDFRVKHFEAFDLVMASICTRFDHPSFIAFSNFGILFDRAS